MLMSCTPHRPMTTVTEALNGFENIQDSTRTKVWWFHGETETTREGITADLEAYKKVGIGGVVYYDQTHGVKESKIKALSPEWWELLKFASQECKRLGLTFETHISNGYVAGGPWITPELSMQELVSTDTVITGGNHVSINLPEVRKRYNYSNDVAVVAFPVDSTTLADSRTQTPHLTVTPASINVTGLFSPGSKRCTFPAMPEGSHVTVTADFKNDFTARSISYSMRPRGKAATSSMQVPSNAKTFNGTGYFELPDLGELEVSTDGVTFTPVCKLRPVYQALGGTNRLTLAFPAVTGRYFRLNLHDWTTPKDKFPELELGEVVISPAAMIDSWEDKASLRPSYITEELTPSYSTAEVINSAQIVDLTAMTDSTGHLDWDAPEGKWKIIRFAHTPTGGHTKHGRPEMNALECDKMSKEAADFHWNSYVAQIIDTIRNCGGRIDGIAMDSHEAGPQNWTKGFEHEFSKMNGYDLVKYLPVMAGYVVDSPEFSARTLYDVRRTIADLTTENYFAEFNRLAKNNNVTFTQQDFGAICYAGDPLKVKGVAQKPQGEFWTHHLDGNYDIKEVSSAAHLYDKCVASAEAFTDINYKMTPADMKWLSDYAYCFGINEFVVCASSHQPWLDKYPGCTGGGRHYAFDRCNTYWDYLAPQMESQARTSYMMRQGTPVIDFCVYLGDNAPLRIVSHKLPDIPFGYDFDAMTTDALINQLSVKDGNVSTKGDIIYTMIILPEDEPLTLAALRKIHSLVKDGAVIYGKKPAGSLSQEEQGEAKEYAELANDLWKGDITNFGKGRVYSGMTLGDAIKAEGIVPDIEVPDSAHLLFNHRTLADGDIYFIANRDKEKPFEGNVTLRTAGQAVEAWHPTDGTRNKLSGATTPDGRMTVQLSMAPCESFIIVVSENPIPGDTGTQPRLDKVTTITTPWNVTFDPKAGGPGEVTFHTLTDWSKSATDGIKYYSGTAIYRNSVNLSPAAKSILEVAPFSGALSVTVNGKKAGTIWCAPWSVDITDAVTEGENVIELAVANTILNRMIGDLALPETERFTYSSTPIVKEGDMLRPSGLKGEVKILQSEQ